MTSTMAYTFWGMLVVLAVGIYLGRAMHAADCVPLHTVEWKHLMNPMPMARQLPMPH